MEEPKTWGDVFWAHIIASKGLMDRADAAYRADQWQERKDRKTPSKAHPNQIPNINERGRE